MESGKLLQNTDLSYLTFMREKYEHYFGKMSKRQHAIFSVVCWSVFLYTCTSLYSNLSLFILMFQKWLNTPGNVTSLIFDFVFWQQDGHFDLLCSCFSFLRFSVKERKRQQTWQQYPIDGYWIFQFDSADLLFTKSLFSVWCATGCSPSHHRLWSLQTKYLPVIGTHCSDFFPFSAEMK